MSINKNYRPMTGPGKELYSKAGSISSKLICMIVGCKLGDPVIQFRDANCKASKGISKMEHNAFREIYKVR